jgi:hypothetical protein
MAEAPKLEQAPSPTQQPGSTETLSSLIEKSRQDKRFDHAELDQVLAKYEAEKNNLNEQFSVKIGEEKSKADALLADSFEDVFEEYKVTSKADFDRVQRLLNIINPIRAERGQVMVFLAQIQRRILKKIRLPIKISLLIKKLDNSNFRVGIVDFLLVKVLQK